MHCETMGRTTFIAFTLLLASCLRTVAEPRIEDKGPAVTPQRVILYDEDQNDPKGRRFVGSAVWRTETVSSGPGILPEMTARADVEIPERHMRMTWSLRRNTDKKLPASHTIEVKFTLTTNFSEGGIDSVPGVLMKSSETARGEPLAGLSVKVSDSYFLIGLSAVKKDVQRNIQLLRDRDWLDIPIVYTSGKRAILAIEKGQSGKRTFAEAFPSWASTSHSNANSDVIAESQTSSEPGSSPPQIQDESAPLGLTWGSTSEEITAQGIELKPFPQKDFGETYLATKLPRALSDQETAALSLGFDNKLFRVAIISRAYENDPSGGAIRSRYAELLATLSEKYGKPYSVQNLGDSIYGQSEYFIAGINGGHSSWYSIYETPRMTIQLGLIADSSSTGRWRIIFEEKSLKKAFDLARKTKEKGAL
jgi:hypothetical protein